MLSTLFLLLLVPPTPLSGSRCIAPGTPTGELGRATAVFTGRVMGRSYVDDNASGVGTGRRRLVVRLKVERVWKGEISEEVLMYTTEVRQPGGLTVVMAEDFVFADGKEYLIYANGLVERLRTSGCTRSREVKDAAEDLRELGAAHEPKRAESILIPAVGGAEQPVAADARSARLLSMMARARR